MSVNVAVVGSGMAGLATAMAIMTVAPSTTITIFSDQPMENTVSYHGGGGLTLEKPQFSRAFLKTVSGNVTNTNIKWLLTTLTNAIISSTGDILVARALAEESARVLVGFGVLPSDARAQCANGQWYNNESVMKNIETKLTANSVKFTTKVITGADDETLKPFTKVFMCRGAADAAVFGSAVELVAGVSQDVPRAIPFVPIVPPSGDSCFRFDGTKFVSPFPDKIRNTGGMHVGYSAAKNTNELSTGDKAELPGFTGARVVSVDMFPFYHLSGEKTIYVNGGSFTGLHTYPAVAMLAAAHGMSGNKVALPGNIFEPELTRVVEKQSRLVMIGLAILVPLLSILLFVIKLVLFFVRILFSLLKAAI